MWENDSYLAKRPYGLCVCVNVCWRKRLVPLTMLNYSRVTSNQVCNISRKRQRSPKIPPSECICSSAHSESRTLWLYLENWNILFLKITKEDKKKKRVKLFFSLVSNTGRCGYNLTDRRASDACDVLKMCSGMESSLRGWFGHECVGAGRMWAWQHKEAGFLLVSGACWVHEVPRLTQRSRWCESMAVYNGCKEGG